MQIFWLQCHVIWDIYVWQINSEKNFGSVYVDDSYDIGVNIFRIFLIMPSIIFPAYNEKGFTAIFK